MHGDLHPAHVLTADGTICDAIDFGDLRSGDPACDLAAAPVLLPDGAADRFHEAYGRSTDPAPGPRSGPVRQEFSGILIGEGRPRPPRREAQLEPAGPGRTAAPRRDRPLTDRPAGRTSSPSADRSVRGGWSGTRPSR
nr:phosphotransferase [Streptomyces sp. NBC_00995]